MGLFSKVEDARVSGKMPYFLPGKYRLRVDKCVVFRSRKQQDLWIVETTIYESSNPAREVGTPMSWTCNLTTQDAALGNAKAFVGACYDIFPGMAGNFEENIKAVKEAHMEIVVANAQPLRNKMMRAVAFNTVTGKGNDFTVVKWFPDSYDTSKEST